MSSKGFNPYIILADDVSPLYLLILLIISMYVGCPIILARSAVDINKGCWRADTILTLKSRRMDGFSNRQGLRALSTEHQKCLEQNTLSLKIKKSKWSEFLIFFILRDRVLCYAFVTSFRKVRSRWWQFQSPSICLESKLLVEDTLGKAT